VHGSGGGKRFRPFHYSNFFLKKEVHKKKSQKKTAREEKDPYIIISQLGGKHGNDQKKNRLPLVREKKPAFARKRDVARKQKGRRQAAEVRQPTV